MSDEEDGNLGPTTKSSISSPTSAALLLDNNASQAATAAEVVHASSHDDVAFPEFLDKLPEAIRQRKDLAVQPGSTEDPILNLMKHVHLQHSDWEPYEFFDVSQNYTRNLIATDHETYTLLLLCWNPGRESHIHDHPCDGCWVRCLQGQIREVRYKKAEETSVVDGSAVTTVGSGDQQQRLVCFQDMTLQKGDMAYIEDAQGYHKMEIPSATIPSVTMHLYSPPVEKCKVWLELSADPCTVSMSNYSEFGKKLSK